MNRGYHANQSDSVEYENRVWQDIRTNVISRLPWEKRVMGIEIN